MTVTGTLSTTICLPRIGVEMEAIAPPFETDHRDCRSGAGAVVFRSYEASDSGLETEDGKIGSIHEAAGACLDIGGRTAHLGEGDERFRDQRSEDVIVLAEMG